MKTLIVCAVSVALCACCPGQSLDESTIKTQLDKLANTYAKENSFMGTVLVAKGDRVILNKAYGTASVEWGVANVSDAKFQIGSLTKQFTAALILLLQEDGKLSIQDPVGKYLPEAPNNSKRVSLVNLLGQTSGIPDFFRAKEFDTWSKSPHTPDETLALIRDMPLDFEPGSKWAYSNSNYLILGAIIEKVSGKKYGDLLRERILEPLGMKDTGFGADEMVLPKRAEGYAQGHESLVLPSPVSLNVAFAAGAMYSTTGDLLKWLQGLFGGKLLSAKSLKLMTTAGKGNYGFGVFVWDRNGNSEIQHAGYIPGYSSSLRYVPRSQIAVIVLSNVWPGGSPGVLGHRLMDVMVGAPMIHPIEKEAAHLEREALAKFVGDYEAMEGSLSIEARGNGLVARLAKSQAKETDLTYEGNRDGHPWFFSSEFGGEIEFLPDPNGAMSGVLLHLGDQDIPGGR